MYHGYGTLETLLPWFPVLVFFPIVVHPLSLLAMPLLLTCGELDTMLLWYSHWNAEYRVAFSAVVALYRVQLQGSTPEYQVPGTATADKPMHTVELEYYLLLVHYVHM